MVEQNYALQWNLCVLLIYEYERWNENGVHRKMAND